MDMLMTKGPESLEWNDKLSFIEVVGDYGPDDKIVELGMKLPWLIKYMMSVPDVLCMRMITRRDYPEPGMLSYIVVPFDRQRGVAVEEVGPMKVKSGVVQAHPSGDPNKSVVFSLDMFGSGMPEWGLSMMMKTMLKSEMKKRTSAFLKSNYYARLMAGR